MTPPPWCTLVRADNPGPMTLEGTNTYVLATSAGNVVVDPGPLIDRHLEAVAALGPVAVVLLTHRHPDHSESSGRFHEMTRAPVLARDPELCVDADPLLVDGDPVAVPDISIRVLHTPGHSSDSVCFDVSGGDHRAVLTGDTILGQGTTVVAHPDGELAPYLTSLARLRDLNQPNQHGGHDQLRVLPGHGPLRPDLRAVAVQYLLHRQERLEQVRSALAAGARTAREVVEIVYADVDRAVWPAAEASVRAQLDYLSE